VRTRLYIEGGGDKQGDIECREAFRKLLGNLGLQEKMPRLVACGGRDKAFESFCANFAVCDFAALLVDSEDPVADPALAWEHLKGRDNWDKPNKANSDQALLMTTCMETWISRDQETLRSHYRDQLQENALPKLEELENRNRHAVQDALAHATRNCTNKYQKGKRSFEIMGKIRPEALRRLSSFQRFERILKASLA